MSYIILTYTLSIAWLFIAFMKYKQNQSVEKDYINLSKISIISSLLIKPLFFTALAGGLNTVEAQLGFFLVGGGHLAVVLYYVGCLYVSCRKQTTLHPEQV